MSPNRNFIKQKKDMKFKFLRLFFLLILSSLFVCETATTADLCTHVFKKKIIKNGPQLITDPLIIAHYYNNPHSSVKDGVLKRITKALLTRRSTEELPFLIGLEVEGTLPVSLSPQEFMSLAKTILAEKFQISVDEIMGSAEIIHFKRKGAVYVLKMVEDSSIVPGLGRQGIEIVSPVLRSSDDLYFYSQWIGELNRIGFQEEPITGGLHFHVGLKPPTILLVDDVKPLNLEAVSLFLKVFDLIEPQLRSALSVSPERSRFILANTSLVNKIDQGNVTQRDIELSGQGNSEKPSVLFSKFGTMEVRIANSTTDPVTIFRQGLFWQGLASAIFSQNPLLMKYLQETPDSLISVNDISDLMGLSLFN